MENPFEYHIKTDDFHLKYACGEPGAKGQEFHAYHEFVFFIKGSAYLISKNIQHELSPGSIVLIPKEQFHQFCVREPEGYVRCILGFYETPEISGLIRAVMDMVKVTAVPDEKITALFEAILEIVKSDLSEDEKILFIRSALAQLLIYFKKQTSGVIRSSIRLSPEVSGALHIIEDRFAENLSLAALAKLLYVSPSTLSHKFRKELNISLYQYISKKRLSAAHARILNGEPMTSAAVKSGFGDYASFYRLYKKYYKK